MDDNERLEILEAMARLEEMRAQMDALFRKLRRALSTAAGHVGKPVPVRTFTSPNGKVMVVGKPIKRRKRSES